MNAYRIESFRYLRAISYPIFLHVSFSFFFPLIMIGIAGILIWERVAMNKTVL